MKISSKAVQFVGVVAATLLSVKAFAAADLKPISLTFEDVPAVGGEFPQAAYQKVQLKFTNVGSQAVGHTLQEICPDFDPSQDLFCNYYVKNSIAGVQLNQMEYAVDAKQYLPGKTYIWEMGLAPNTLKHCDAVSVAMDLSHTAGQAGAPNPYANDKATLKAFKKGARLLCVGGFGLSPASIESGEEDAEVGVD